MSGETHERSIVVWDVPTAVEIGRAFGAKVGLKCREGCSPKGWTVEVRDHESRSIVTAAVGDTAWRGTEGLYWANVTLIAPEAAGSYAWEAVAAPDDGPTDGPTDGRHGEVRAPVNVRAVPKPECRLTVVAIDRESQAPVAGARVVVHPYRAVTDENGIAELALPKGAYRLFVSGRDHLPFRGDGEITVDRTIRAELDVDRGPSDAELWS